MQSSAMGSCNVVTAKLPGILRGAT
jgi:hypothetical protein